MSCIANAAPGPARRGRSLFRDRLLIALLIARPLRRANMAALRLGTSLQRRGAAWWIAQLLRQDAKRQVEHARAMDAPSPMRG
jgi:hypothetical protein